jgi:hypothetical protein
MSACHNTRSEPGRKCGCQVAHTCFAMPTSSQKYRVRDLESEGPKCKTCHQKHRYTERKLASNEIMQKIRHFRSDQTALCRCKIMHNMRHIRLHQAARAYNIRHVGGLSGYVRPHELTARARGCVALAASILCQACKLSGLWLWAHNYGSFCV